MPRDPRYPFFRSTEADIVVPAGKVWLQGDNIRNSTDSRNYGPVPLPLITGRVFAKVRQQACTSTIAERNAGHHETPHYYSATPTLSHRTDEVCGVVQVWSLMMPGSAPLHRLSVCLSVVCLSVCLPACLSVGASNGGDHSTVWDSTALFARAQVWPLSEAGLLEQMYPPPMMR